MNRPVKSSPDADFAAARAARAGACMPDDDYEAIEAAVMESPRGRRFLAEYLRRHTSAEMARLIEAVEQTAAAVRESIRRQVEEAEARARAEARQEMRAALQESIAVAAGELANELSAPGAEDAAGETGREIVPAAMAAARMESLLRALEEKPPADPADAARLLARQSAVLRRLFARMSRLFDEPRPRAAPPRRPATSAAFTAGNEQKWLPAAGLLDPAPQTVSRPAPPADDSAPPMPAPSVEAPSAVAERAATRVHIARREKLRIPMPGTTTPAPERDAHAPPATTAHTPETNIHANAHMNAHTNVHASVHTNVQTNMRAEPGPAAEAEVNAEAGVESEAKAGAGVGAGVDTGVEVGADTKVHAPAPCETRPGADDVLAPHADTRQAHTPQTPTPQAQSPQAHTPHAKKKPRRSFSVPKPARTGDEAEQTGQAEQAEACPARPRVRLTRKSA